MNVALLVAVLGPLIAAIGAYAAAARKLSGKIETTAAEELWAESRSIRSDLQERNEFLVERIGKLESRIEGLEKRNWELYQENGNLRRLIAEHEKTITTLRGEVDALRRENDRLTTRIEEHENDGG